MIVINGFIQHEWEYQTQHMTTWRIHQCHGTVQTATDQITQLYCTTLVAVLPTVFHRYNLTPLIRQLAR
jgi:hypothetical protein